MTDPTARVITVRSDGGLVLKMRRNVQSGEAAKTDMRSGTEIKIIGATHPIASTAMNTTAATISRREVIANVGTGITTALTVDGIKISRMTTNGRVRNIGDEVGHAIDLDRAPHDQRGNIISVTTGHTAQPDPSLP